MNRLCNSGGAVGADTVFEKECISHGIPVIAWSFDGHNTKSPNSKILTEEELDEGFEHIKIANKTLNRNLYNLKPFVKNLLSRNWFQVKDSEAIFAIGRVESDRLSVCGGTGWACAMGIDNYKPVYVFDQYECQWFKFSYVFYEFKRITYRPILTEIFAGIGTRDINENGIKAIKSLFS